MYATITPERVQFSGHETFSLRYSWLTKGYDALCEDAGYFEREDALLGLGVGFNMVRAIRHWGRACGIWKQVPEGNAPTALGHAMFRQGGWDRYLERVGSTWVLHWQLVRGAELATTFAWVFSNPRSDRFDRDMLVQELVGLSREARSRSRAASTLRKDVDVFLRSYLQPRPRDGMLPEEALFCPLTSLGLIRPGLEKGIYELVSGTHPSLPLYVFEAALIDFLERRSRSTQHVVSLDELLYGTWSPGRMFRLSAEGLGERLDALCEVDPERYLFDDTAGLRQLMTRGVLPDPLQVLRAGFYREGRA